MKQCGKKMVSSLPLAMRASAVCMRHPAVGRRTVLAPTLKLASGSVFTRATTPQLTPLRLLHASSQPSLRSSNLGVRAFTTSFNPNNQTRSASPASPSSLTSSATTRSAKVLATYEGPLARTFTRLKLFSLASLGLASVLTPVLLLAPGEISLAGRVGLCITALATSAVSTALIAWIGTPYVGSMRLLSPSTSTSASATENVVMELNTVSWRLRPQRTLVYEPTFLRPTSRPFAAWEISNNPPPLSLPTQHQQLDKKIAETFDVKTGASLGSWSVTYSAQTQTNDAQPSKALGKVQVQGKPTRYFNVHEELLDEHWQVLG